MHKCGQFTIIRQLKKSSDTCLGENKKDHNDGQVAERGNLYHFELNKNRTAVELLGR